MLSKIRNFSSSIYAKILLFVVAIPFIFWGMGPVFQSGKLNTIAEIGKEKISTQEFVDYVQYQNPNNEPLNKNSIDKLLYNFIGAKLISEEIKRLDIILSDKSLSKIIKNEKIFKKENEFSRTEYEKFLISKKTSAANFENIISEQNKRQQFFDYVSGGLVPSDFLINLTNNEINQKRHIEIINLNEVFEKKINIGEKQIESYFNENSDDFKILNKTINYVKLNPKNLTGNDEFSNLFFEKLDEIDDLIVNGTKLDIILNQFNLGPFDTLTLSEANLNKNNNNLPDKLLKKAFNINDEENTVLIEDENNFFIFELKETVSLQKDPKDKSVRNKILNKLKKKEKTKLLSMIIGKIQSNNFDKNNFLKMAKDENVNIKQAKIENRSDESLFKEDLVNQIYSFAEKKVIVVADTALVESYLIYIEKVENSSIEAKSKDFENYYNISKSKLTNLVFNTYEQYLKNKHKIEINYKALDKVNNYYR
tara:strand:- start:3888 stop:5327 length:1440 start_codon:yes stop_codon:yes gene_type:complete